MIISREKLSELPYSVDEIFGIRTRGKYAGLVGEYTTNEFYRIYGNRPTDIFEPDVIIAGILIRDMIFGKQYQVKQDVFQQKGKQKF